jgi:HD-like signal output (HDOD) protein
MSAITLEQAVAKLRDLPSLPSVVTQLIRTFDQADIGIGELAAQISKDQALAAKTDCRVASGRSSRPLPCWVSTACARW